MIEIGVCKELRIVRFAKVGAYLQSGSEEVLLPNKYLPKDAKIEDKLQVFLYTDSEDRPIATTLTPKAQRGEIAALKVVDKNNFGCFLDLGIAKDIFMPTNSPQKYPLGSQAVVFVSVDRENRLIAKENIKPYLNNFQEKLRHFKVGFQVKILPFRISPLGYECVINGLNLGLLHKNEVFGKLPLGEQKDGFIKRIYPDGKCDLSLKNPIQKTSSIQEGKKVLEILRQKGGKLNLHYDSDPKEIELVCAMSKKAFKRALSALLKANKITLIPKAGIELL
ncbi:S1-like domain-containing RNA-binding protein [Helicobacter sp. MIT 05-5294]|uniref:CvfB family protein n=1 Tax=Helicobacter sp. MIT 05-5294 TaxID=1548150 RepID=UPI000AD65D3A|nr:S1-like domain-containing RNA-binding protein [Helicobacter sp. MIT 05-5294]